MLAYLDEKRGAPEVGTFLFSRSSRRPASREEFTQLVDEGAVGPDTVVFDNTIQTTGALRDRRWEVPARRSWHGRGFFSNYSANAK